MEGLLVFAVWYAVGVISTWGLCRLMKEPMGKIQFIVGGLLGPFITVALLVTWADD